MRDVFARLVAADGTRVPLPRAELAHRRAQRRASHLVDARLLTAREAVPSEPTRRPRPVRRRSRSSTSASPNAGPGSRAGAPRTPPIARCSPTCAPPRAAGSGEQSARRLLWRGPALADLRRLAARTTALTGASARSPAASPRAQPRAPIRRAAIVVAVIAVLAGVASVMAYLSIVANENARPPTTSALRATDSAQLAETR